MAHPGTASLHWFVILEGFGSSSSTAGSKTVAANGTALDGGLIRLTNQPVPAWDTGSLYAFALVGYPQMDALTVDPREGKTSEGGCNFTLGVDNDDTHSIRDVWMRRVQARVGTIDAGSADDEIAHDATTITVSGYTSGADSFIHAGRECIKLGTHAGSGQYTSCTRGHFGTTASRHGHGAPVFAKLKAKRRRRVWVGYYDADTASSYDDEVIVQQYTIHDIAPTGRHEYRFECDGLLSPIHEVEVLPRQWLGQAYNSGALLGSTEEQREQMVLFGHAPEYRDTEIRLPWTLQSARTASNGGSGDTRGGSGAEPSAGDNFWVKVNNTVCKAYVLYVEKDALNRVVSARYVADLRMTALDPAEMETNLEDPDIREVFLSAVSTITNDGSSKARLPLGQPNYHPLNIWLHVATSTDHGSNGDYDTGVPFIDPPIPADWFDIDDIEAQMRLDPERYAVAFVLGTKDRQKAIEQLDKLLIGSGFVRTEASDGRITFARIADTQQFGVTEIDINDIDIVIDDLDGSPDDVFDEAGNLPDQLDETVVLYDQDSQGRPRKLRVQDVNRRREVFGVTSEAVLDLSIYRSRDVVLGMGIDYQARWREEVPVLRFRAPMSIDLRPGTPALLTSQYAMGHDNSNDAPEEGVTSSRIWISSRLLDAEAGEIEYEAYHIGIGGFQKARIAPALKISGARTGTSVPVYTSEFTTSNRPDSVSDDLDAFVTDSKVMVVSGTDMSVIQQGLTMTHSGSSPVTLTTISSTVADGDFIVPDDYDQWTSAQKAAYSAYADANDTLGSGGDAGHEYEG